MSARAGASSSLAAHQNATARSLLAVSDRLVKQAQELGHAPPSTARRGLVTPSLKSNALRF